jgi:AcrR family transcriptional regulator
LKYNFKLQSSRRFIYDWKVPKAKITEVSVKNRQAAFIARQKEALLKGGVEVIIAYGLNASIEQIVQVNQVSATTIYKYFENRETYLGDSLLSIWLPWQSRTLEFTSQDSDPLAKFILPMRICLRISTIDPKMAQILKNSDVNLGKVFEIVHASALEKFRGLTREGILPDDRVDFRFRLFAGSLLSLVANAAGGLPVEESERGLELILPLLGLTKAQIKKVMNLPLPAIPAQ